MIVIMVLIIVCLCVLGLVMSMSIIFGVGWVVEFGVLVWDVDVL